MALSLRHWACTLGAIGATLRALYIFWAHPALAYDFSDMHGYIEHAQRILLPGREGIYDTFHPPGAALLFGLLHSLDPSWHLVYAAQWLMCVSLMLLTWDVARRLYNPPTAHIAVMLCALHYPLVHYAGFCMAENGFAFFALVCFDTFVIAWQAPAWRRRLLAAAASGLFLGLATAFKNSMLGPAAVLMLGTALMAYRQRRSRLLAIGAAAMCAAATVLVPLAQRCTRLHEGTFCLAAANSGANILIGHGGGTRMFFWHDTVRHIEMGIGSPDASMRHYEHDVQLPFGGYDDARNLQTAMVWMRAHPWEALGLSFRNVLDLFAMPTLWPGAQAFGVDWGHVSQALFWLFILAPACAWLVSRKRALWLGTPGVEAEWLLLLPLLGLMATVFISVSEVRYRVPFDPLLIVLAARGYASLLPSLDAPVTTA